MTLDSLDKTFAMINTKAARVGKEHTPITVVDTDPENARHWQSKASDYAGDWMLANNNYPGRWSRVPDEYFGFIEAILPHISEHFSLKDNKMTGLACCYAKATCEPSQLKLKQRLPHFDNKMSNQLATVHYLFEQKLGGTGIYKHNSTAVERVTEDNLAAYLSTLKSQLDLLAEECDGYFDGSNSAFERIYHCEEKMGRIFIYPSNILHSGCIPNDLDNYQDLSGGRLTITSFITFENAIG